MPRGLDHIVHAVGDLEAAAEFYSRCGFQVGARNRHPWGTHNHVVQLPGFFIEVLTITEPAKLGDDGLSQHFGAFQRDAIARGDGLSMLVVESTDVEADVADFTGNGIGCSQALPFSRQAVLLDGSTATVGFSLAFARDKASPQTGYAACQQLNPEAFWNAAWQQHGNNATGVAGVVLVAENPEQHTEFLRRFTGVDDSEPRVDDVALRTPRGDVEVITPAVFSERYGAVAETGQGASLAGLRIAVENLDDVETILRAGEIPLHRSGAMLAVPRQAAFGATLIFEQAAIS